MTTRGGDSPFLTPEEISRNYIVSSNIVSAVDFDIQIRGIEISELIQRSEESVEWVGLHRHVFNLNTEIQEPIFQAEFDSRVKTLLSSGIFCRYILVEASGADDKTFLLGLMPAPDVERQVLADLVGPPILNVLQDPEIIARQVEDDSVELTFVLFPCSMSPQDVKQLIENQFAIWNNWT